MSFISVAAEGIFEWGVGANQIARATESAGPFCEPRDPWRLIKGPG